MKLLFWFFLVCGVSSCSTTPKMPPDFYFKISDFDNVYDSRTGAYTRRAVTYNFKDTTVYVKLDTIELNKIYQTMMTKYALKLPDGFKCAPNSEYTIPSRTAVLQIQMDKVYRSITYDYGCSEPIDKWSAANFSAVDSIITATLATKSIIKNLPSRKFFDL